MEFVVRDLEKGDFSKGFPGILGQLTTVGEVSQEILLDRFEEINSSPDYKVIVIEDPKSNKIIATASLLIERKFIRSCGKAGHIEDVVVDQTYRGKHLGQRVIEALLVAAKEAGCYKVILDCAEANAAFYEKCGLTRKEVQMVKYF
ncbi:Glucosamine 6-phosphate N-acetyltransferase [Coccomyxa sp. Obi]|nr:Glucosamine 6-phosphate N-acetyltransferase [Coccomyxa sp. Obi]